MNSLRKLFTFKSLIFFTFIFLAACSKDKTDDQVIIPEVPDTPVPIIYNDKNVDNTLKINQLQYLSSHNSYRKHTDEVIYKFLQSIETFIPLDLIELEYDHVDMYTQLERYGVRHVEIDVYGDKKGGRFYNRAGYKLTGRDEASGIEELKNPGIKVLHLPDIDFETHYYTFVQALEDIKRWSKKYSDHLPLFIMIETKTETVASFLPIPGFANAESWDSENIEALESDILKVFSKDRIIKPDDVRGEYSTLREAVLQKGWPTVGESRGKVMFLFDQTDIGAAYRGGNSSLEGKLIFTNAKPSDPDAAFIKRNDPSESDIQSLVEQGFLVRSMVGGVMENLNNDYSKFEMAKNKGAHFLSTDYYKPDERVGKVEGWTDFTIGVEQHSYQMNPITK